MASKFRHNIKFPYQKLIDLSTDTIFNANGFYYNENIYHLKTNKRQNGNVCICFVKGN